MAVGPNRLAIASTAITGTATFTRPAGVLNTDLVVVTAALRADGTVTAPAGFTVQPRAAESAINTELWVITGPAGSLSSWQFTSSVANVAWVLVGAYPDAAYSLFAVVGSASTGGTQTCPSVEGVNGGAIVAGYTLATNSADPVPPPSPFVYRGGASNGGKNTTAQANFAGDELLTAAGPTGTRVYTVGGNNNHIDYTILLTPTAPTGPATTPVSTSRSSSWTVVGAPPPQYLRPIGSGVVGGTWVTSSGVDAAVDGWTLIDEPVPDATDWIGTPTNPDATVFYTARLSAGRVPASTSTVTLRAMADKDAGSRTIELVAEVRQGDGIIVASLLMGLLNSDSPTVYSYTLTEAEAGAISDWSDVRVRLNPSTAGGGSGSAARVHWLELEVPEGLPTASVSTSRSSSWTTRASRSTARASSWEVQATAPPVPVSTSRSTSWSLAGSVASVTTARSSSWAVRQQLSTGRSTTWQASSATSAARSSSWAVLTSTAASRGTTWETQQAAAPTPVSRAVSTTWAVAGATTQYASGGDPARGTLTFTNAGNVSADDGLVATAAVSRRATGEEWWLVPALPGISPADTIHSVQVEVEWRVTAANSSTVLFQMYVGGTAKAGTYSRATGPADPTALTLVSFTPTGVTAAELAGSGLAVLTRFTPDDANATYEIDHVRISATYTPAIVTAPVSRAVSTTWTVVAAPTTTVSAARSTTWTVSAAVAAARGTSWHVRVPVATARVVSWVTRSSAAATRATSWSSRTSASTARAASWTVRARSSSGRSTTWNVRVSAATGRSTTWSTRSSTSTGRSSSWTTRARLTSARPSSWTVHAQTAVARSSSWQTLAGVAVSRGSSWSIASTIVTVSTSRSTTWKLAGRLLVPRSSSWAVRQPATASRAASWTTRRELLSGRSTSWATRQARQTSRASSWALLAGASTSRASSWEVRELLEVSASSTWELFAGVELVRSTAWIVRGFVDTDRAASWQDSQLVELEVSTSWALQSDAILSDRIGLSRQLVLTATTVRLSVDAETGRLVLTASSTGLPAPVAGALPVPAPVAAATVDTGPAAAAVPLTATAVATGQEQ